LRHEIVDQLRRRGEREVGRTGEIGEATAFRLDRPEHRLDHRPRPLVRLILDL
jgi:hypothetical protein